MEKPRLPFFRNYFATVVAALLVATLASSAHAQSAANPASKSVTHPSRIDVNSAELKQLETLPGVGPTLAQRIVEGRPYKSLADLEKVKGLGKAKADALKDQVMFGPTTPPERPKSPNVAKPKQADEPKPAVSGNAAGGTANPPSGKGSVKPGTHLAPGERININMASVEQLDKLPGIGPAKAQAILDYRTQNGSFKSIEDIQKVRGIKTGLFEKIKDHIKVSD